MCCFGAAEGSVTVRLRGVTRVEEVTACTVSGSLVAIAPSAVAAPYRVGLTTATSFTENAPLQTYGSKPKVEVTVDGVSGKGAPSGNVTFTISPAPSGTGSLTEVVATTAVAGQDRSTAAYTFPADAKAGVTYSVSASFAPTGPVPTPTTPARRRRTPTSPSSWQQPRRSARPQRRTGCTNPVVTATITGSGSNATPSGTVKFVVKRPNGDDYSSSDDISISGSGSTATAHTPSRTTQVTRSRPPGRYPVEVKYTPSGNFAATTDGSKATTNAVINQVPTGLYVRRLATSASTVGTSRQIGHHNP